MAPAPKCILFPGAGAQVHGSAGRWLQRCNTGAVGFVVVLVIVSERRWRMKSHGRPPSPSPRRHQGVIRSSSNHLLHRPSLVKFQPNFDLFLRVDSRRVCQSCCCPRMLAPFVRPPFLTAKIRLALFAACRWSEFYFVWQPFLFALPNANV
jgi:hypothetical protein